MHSTLNNMAHSAAAAADRELNNPTIQIGANIQAQIDAAYDAAMQHGRDRARGESAVTMLAFGFQALVNDGSLTEGHAEQLYLRHVAGHNEFVRANPQLGKEEMPETAEALKSNISTLRTFARKGARQMGADGLYERVLLIRSQIGRDSWAQKSAFNAFVKVNRMVAGLCAKCLNEAAFPTISDAELEEWLSAKPKATSDDLTKAIDALRKAVEARPGDLALNEVFQLVERYGSISAVEPAEMPKVIATTNFDWRAPIVK